MSTNVSSTRAEGAAAHASGVKPNGTPAAGGDFADVLVRARRAADVARAAAPTVDKEARFPREAFEALKAEQLLGAAVPRALGGLGCSVTEVATLCQTLGQACAATGMIYAMHAIQVACMARHGSAAPLFRGFLQECAERQLLVASATSEVGVGGDMRSSVCAIEPAATAASFALKKSSSVCSYGEQADAILITSRRGQDASANDQVLTLIRKGDYTLEKTGTWDTLGMRGTCSPGFQITVGESSREQILPQPFADIASQTMVPYSHIVWSSVWLGIATDAFALARSFIRADARKRPGTMPFGSPRLAEAATVMQIMRSVVNEAAREYEALQNAPDGPDVLSSIGYALKINNLKVTSSQLVVQVVTHALSICGMAGYSNASKFSLGRHLRDSLGAALMIANDRIQATNASLLLVHKDV